MKRRLKLAVDVLMFAAFCYLTGYHPGAGVLAHGIVGITLFALFIIHHLLNLGWYKALPKGKHPFERSAFIALDFIFFADMILMAISSVLMSELVFAFSPIHSTQFGRSLHVGSTSWGFLIMTLHVGLHLDGKLTKLERKLKSAVSRTVYKLICAALFCAGIASLFNTGLAGKLILRTSWASHTPIFYIELLLITTAAVLLVHFIYSLRRKLKQRHNH